MILVLILYFSFLFKEYTKINLCIVVICIQAKDTLQIPLVSHATQLKCVTFEVVWHLSRYELWHKDLFFVTTV